MFHRSGRALLGLALALVTLPLVSGSVSAQGCAVPPLGCIGWWPGEDDGTESVLRHDGVLVNGTGFEPAFVGSGFRFDGINDRVEIPHRPSDPRNFLASESFSYSAWVRTSITATAEVIEKQQDPNNAALPFYQMLVGADGRVACGIGSAGTIVQFYGATPINDGLFHHCACVRDVAQDALILYIDGQEDGRQADGTTQSFSHAGALTLGGPRRPDHAKLSGQSR